MINTDKLNKLFEELVPSSGAAETVAGEIVRAAMRICYRFYNDGDLIGVDYGNETCNYAARYLMAKLPKEDGNIVAEMWGHYDEDKYENLLEKMTTAVVAYIESNPGLKTEKNTDDIQNYIEDEDTDYLDEEEDDYEEEEYDDEEYDEEYDDEE